MKELATNSCLLFVKLCDKFWLKIESNRICFEFQIRLSMFLVKSIFHNNILKNLWTQKNCRISPSKSKLNNGGCLYKFFGFSIFKYVLIENGFKQPMSFYVCLPCQQYYWAYKEGLEVHKCKIYVHFTQLLVPQLW